MNDAISGTSTARPTTHDGASAPVLNADSPIVEAGRPARRATNGPTGLPRLVNPPTDEPSGFSLSGTPSNTDAGAGSPVVGRTASPSPKSSTSSFEPVKDSTGHWRAPVDVMELVAQANALATDVLNGTADPAAARAYAEISHVIAKLLRIELERRRFAGRSVLEFPGGG